METTSRARFLEVVRHLGSVDVESYAAARFGSLVEDPELRARFEALRAAGVDELEAVETLRHQLPARLFELALERLGQRARILDLGCGEGSLVNFGRDYASLPNPIVAVDQREPRVRFPAHVEFRRADLATFEWRGEPFELVLGLHMWEMVADTARLLAALRAALRPGGRALLAVSDARFAHSLLKRFTKRDEDYDERAHHTLESFDALLRAAGFERTAWATWPSYHSIHHGGTSGPDGRSLGAVLDELALHFDRANGTLGFSTYGYGLLYRAL
jgi:SAM-dependent methyltransferase